MWKADRIRGSIRLRELGQMAGGPRRPWPRMELDQEPTRLGGYPEFLAALISSFFLGFLMAKHCVN